MFKQKLPASNLNIITNRSIYVPMNYISIDAVTKTYKTGLNKKHLAVNGVTFGVGRGEVLGIVGANGAGKSSVIKMIMGFTKPDSGTIKIIDQEPGNPKSRNRIGYLPENPYLYDHLTANELLRFSASASGMDVIKAEANIDRYLKIVKLDAFKHRRLRTFSKGMTQRAGLCFALVHDPEIVILDEPMSGLDPLGRRMVIDLIQDLKRQGKTILFCSHILSDVERVCDRIAVMNEGHLVKILLKEEITTSVEDAFLELIGKKDDFAY